MQKNQKSQNFWKTWGSLLPIAVSSVGIFLSATGFGRFTLAEEGENPTRLRRSDSFFGVHFDFHCGLTDENVGGRTTPEMVEAILDLTHPDYIQIDCKGHPGVSSYPTKVGNPSPHLVGDPLKVWRDATARRGVGLYMHYSGVWDSRAAELHPDWTVTKRNGSRSDEKMSVFGPYADELLIPQLIELATEYGVDGAWVDGECWATEIDYGDVAKEKFREKTRIATIPNGKEDEHWLEWTQFHREAFRDYLRHYITAVKESAPNFQIASNWAFTDHMPEAVCAPVDYISGDYTPSNSVNSARFSSRLMQGEGIGWDLMAWSFSRFNDSESWSPKPAVQLMREAACVMAQGGGFQAYFTQERDGSVHLDKLAPMAETANFCRARQGVSHRSTPVSQVALILPTTAHYRRISREGGSLFPWVSWQKGILEALLEINQSVEVLTDSAASPRLEEIPLIVICQWEELDEAFRMELVERVRTGGRLLLIGEPTIRLFNDALAASEGKTSEKLGRYEFTHYFFDDGTITCIPYPWTDEFRSAPEEIREALAWGIRATGFEPKVEFEGRPELDVSVCRMADGGLAVHLVNVSGPHATEPFCESIEPVGPVRLTIRSGMPPSNVRLEPGNRPLDFTYTAGKISLEIDSVPIHEIITVR